MNKIRLIGAVAFAAALSMVSAFGGEALPPPVNGVVTLQSGTTYTVTENTSLAGISEISVVEGSTLEYDVAESQTLEVTCKVKGKGLLVKNGPGLAIHACSDFDNGKAYYIEYPGYTIVNAGTLRGPAMASAYNYSTYYVGRLVVNNPGKYDIASPGKTEVYGLWGDGEVTCSRSGAYNQLAINTDKGKAGETYCAPSQFSGLISGGALRNSPAGYFDILSSDNTCAGEQLIGGGADIGIMRFGEHNAYNGSLGKPGITCRGGTTKLRYLGTGETATKSINYSAGGGDLEIDAGATGGLTLAGAVTASQDFPSGFTVHKLILSGDNANPCALTGTMKDWYVKEGVTKSRPIAVYKRGTGTWKLASSSGDYSGLVAVENGTLQFDTVAAKGKNSSLGNATNTTDYAVLLGAKDTVGTLEYVGSTAVACAGRTIAVTGKGGRLSASAGTIDWTGVTAAAPTTLYLGGAADGNVLRDASGAVSVVQDGTGRWFVDGSSTFSGALTANAGELIARADVTKRTFDFKWFKFVIRAKNRVRPDGQEVSDGNVELEELGFFDENGNRILDGFEFVTTNPEQANKSIPFPDLSDIQPGQYGWLPNAKSTTYNAYGNRDADCLFDNKVSGSGPGLCIVFQSNKPLIDDPGTWYTLLVRMPADAPKVATFDVMSKYGGTSDRGVTCWTMMGSEDGVLWYTLKTYDDPDNANPPASSQWYSDHVKTFDTHVGYSATTVEEATDGRFPNVEKVSVGAGATMRMVGEADFNLLEMNGGAWKADTGMSYAFGALDVLAAGSTMLVPDGATVTFGDSSARTWPADARLDITTEGSGKVEFAGLSLAQTRQVYVNGVSHEEQETERVVFLGDSITCGGYWEYILQDFEATRNPGKLIRNYNAGIAGDTASGALGRLDRDVFARNPARVYVMFGMNDVGLSNYCETPTAAQLAAQAKSMAAFAQSMSNIVDQVLARNVAVTLVTPTPFDEYGDYAGANHVNANERGLATAAQIVRDLAAYRKTDLIDLHAPMTAIYKVGAVKFNRDDRVHPEWRGHVLMSALVWKQLGYDAAPYSERTFAAPGGRATVSYVPGGLPFPQNEDFAAVKSAAPDLIASLNREIVTVTDLPQGTFTLKANGVAIGDYTTAQLTAGVDLGEAATPSQTAAQAAWAKMKSLVGKDYALRYVVAMEIKAKALDPSIDLEDYDAVCALLDQWVEGLTSQQEYYRGVVNLYKDNKKKVAQVEDESTQIWRELNDLGVPQPYELSIEQKGMLVIPANQGDVVKAAEEVEAAEAISIGEGSRLVIRDAGSADEPIEIKANISGAGGLFVGNAYVGLSGDNRVWTGEKMFTNAFVTISSRYGLGSSDVELKNYLDNPAWGYLHFVGNGLTNDVPIHAYGFGYNPASPATAFTANAADPFVMNGGLCFVEASTAKLGNYELRGGFYGAGNAWLGCATGCEPWISGPFKVTSGTYLVVADFTLHLVGDPTSAGWFPWLYLRGGKVVCESENVWGKNLGLGEHGGGAARSSGTFDLNGYDQTFETVRFYNNISVERDWTDLKLYVTSSVSATLTMTGNGDRYREGIRFTGAAGFRYTGTGAWTNTLFRSTTTGTLTVGDGSHPGKGEVFFDWGARWDGDVVLDGGRFGCDTSNGIGHKAKVTISNGGKLIVPAGVNLRVREVTVDGVKQPDGVYQNVDWIEGEGTVRCGKFGLSVIVR